MELKVEIPDELKLGMEESNLDISRLVKEFIALKVFEKQLSESRALQRAIFESLIGKSRLSKQDAKELADKVNTGMFKELKERFPAL